MSARFFLRCFGVALAAAATLSPPLICARAQGLSAIADKTVVYVIAYSGDSFANTIYIARSGHIYSTTDLSSVTGEHAASGFSGGEYQIGKTIEFDHGIEAASVKCHSRSHASFSGRVLTLSSTSTCSAPLVAATTSSSVIKIEFQGSNCKISWTPATPSHVTSCQVVDGNQLRQ